MSNRLDCGHHKRFINASTGACQACAIRRELPDDSDFLVDNRYPPTLVDALGGIAALFPPKQNESTLATIETMRLEDFSACPLSELNGFDADEMTVDVEWVKRVITYMSKEHKPFNEGEALADEVLIQLGHHLEVASL